MAVLEENDILFAHKAFNIVSGLTEATRRVAGAIIDHFNKRTGQCDPSIERLATLLGIDRATVIRATEKLHELGLIQKDSHGGKAHRASYLPNWDHFRFIVAEWDASMKTGRRPSKSNDHNKPADANVASLQRSQSQGCDVKGRTAATQTLRSNPSNKPIEENTRQRQKQEPSLSRPAQPLHGLWKGNKPTGQRSMLLPLNGGRSLSHAEAARAAAERHWYGDVHRLGLAAEAEIIDWMTPERQEATTLAEMKRKGGGLEFILSARRTDMGRMHG